MSRLIDAEPLERQLKNLVKSWSGTFSGPAYQNALERVQDAPTVSAVVLPCELGTTVYIIGSKYRSGQVEYYINTGKFKLYDLEQLGKTIFLTRKEAETEIAERKKMIDHSKDQLPSPPLRRK